MATYINEISLKKVNDYGKAQDRKIEISDEGIEITKTSFWRGRVVLRKINFEIIFGITYTLDPSKYMTEDEIKNSTCKPFKIFS